MPNSTILLTDPFLSKQTKNTHSVPSEASLLTYQAIGWAPVYRTKYSYDAVGQLLSEDGPWTSDTVSHTYTNRLRTGLSLAQPGASAWTNGYLYDSAKRLTNITSQASAFGYAYGAPSTLGSPEPGEGGASALVRKLTLPNGSFITNTYDNDARLLSTKLLNPQLTTLNSHQYGYNAGNQRTQQVFTAGNFANYSYDNIGQLKTAFGKESGGTANRWQEQLGYAYDATGNLNFRTNNTLIQTFNVNSLNELTTVARDGNFTVAGGTMGPATSVTVNASNALLYADGSFVRTNVALTNGINAFTAIARDNWNRSATNTVTAWLPTNAAYQYDLNGNLLTDGLRCFAWDDENQLVSVWVTNAWRSDFHYDGRLRRRVRIEFTWGGANWAPTNEVHYVYDGNLVIQERDGNNSPQVTYTRGLDLSGSLHGAGGIGGLLSRRDANATAFYHSDGNGNVTCLIGSTNLVLARYAYDPFGNTLSKRGPLADANLYRFSSKEFHPNSGLIYYLFRFYDPSLQRWPNADPFGTVGGMNVFAFVKNSPILSIDALGLAGGNVKDIVQIAAQQALRMELALYLNSPGLGFFGGAYWWLFGNGSPVHVPFEVYDPGWGPMQFDKFSGEVADVCADCGSSHSIGEGEGLTKLRDLYTDGYWTILTKGGPGRITVRLRGDLTSKESAKGPCNCGWEFDGEVTVDPDRFDFNNPEFLSTGRTIGGEIITDIMWYLHTFDQVGTDFSVYFDGRRIVKTEGECP
jgi:RHS repeat-associated protein